MQRESALCVLFILLVLHRHSSVLIHSDPVSTKPFQSGVSGADFVQRIGDSHVRLGCEGFFFEIPQRGIFGVLAFLVLSL